MEGGLPILGFCPIPAGKIEGIILNMGGVWASAAKLKTLSGEEGGGALLGNTTVTQSTP